MSAIVIRGVAIKPELTLSVALALVLLISCGSRGSLFGGPEQEPETGGTSSEGGSSGGARSTGGTGGVPEDPCQDVLDLNAGPGDWLPQQRIAPVEVDGYSVSFPSIVASNHGVSFAFMLGPPLGVDEADGFTPGVMFSHSSTPLNAATSRTNFTVELVDPSALAGGSLATDGESYFISYQSSDGLRLASRTNEDWTLEVVDPIGSLSDGVWTSQTAVDDDGTVHIVYEAFSDLRHAKKEDGAWAIETIASLNESSHALNLDVDGSGTPHVIWIQTSGTEPVLMYAFWQGGWVSEEVEVPVPAQHASLAISEEGRPHVAFLNGSLQSAPPFLGRREAEGWEFEEIAPMPAVQGSGSISLDLDPGGFSHVFISSTYATNRSGAWESAPVVLSADDGASLVVDASGAAHAVARYFNYPNNVAPQYKTNRAVAPDGLDQNCDGVDGIDADGDGIASLWTGGSDCDDSNPSIIECTSPQ